MYLFLIMTSAQLMNAIVLSKTVFKDVQCDAYLISSLDKYHDSVEKSQVFHKVYSYDLLPDIAGRQNPFKRSIVRIKNAIDVKKILGMLPNDPKDYKCIFASGISLRNYEIYYAIKQVNPSVKISLYEEGLCEYYILTEKSKGKKAFSHFFFNSYYLEDCRELYVYEPRVVKKYWENINVKAIPKFYNNPELMRILNGVFGFTSGEAIYFPGKIIFLESCYDYDLESENKQLAFLNKVVDIFGVNNVIVKMHPRSPKGKYPERIKTIYSTVPFELIAANVDLNKCVFVSTYTSAIVNPKLMLDQEPFVVCLERLSKNNRNEMDLVFDRVADLYKSNSFYLPETDEQYQEALKSIKERMLLNKGKSI